MKGLFGVEATTWSAGIVAKQKEWDVCPNQAHFRFRVWRSVHVSESLEGIKTFPFDQYTWQTSKQLDVHQFIAVRCSF